MLAQQPRARSQLRLRNHKEQDPSGLQPAIRMLKKHEFQPLVVCLTYFKVIRRIQVEQGQSNGGVVLNVQGVGLQSLNALGPLLVPAWQR